MDAEEDNANNLGDVIAKDSARTSYNEKSVSYVKPIINELVRTQVCFPNIKLLVDRISTVEVASTTESSGLKAYRMYLTDREKTIQAVIKRRLHKWLTTFDVREGSYVILKEYNLARGKRLHGEGEVFYLAISDFYPIGEEQRYNSSTEPNSVSASAEENDTSPFDQAPVRDQSEGNEVERIRTDISLPGKNLTRAYQDIDGRGGFLASKVATTEPKKRKRGTSSLDLDPDLLSLANKVTKPPVTPSAQPKSSGDHFSSASESNILLPRQDVMQTPVSPEPIKSPFNLSTLASVTGPNATRNKQVNILAMIDYVSSSTVKPTTAPLKRDVRLVDPTTDKKVTLSVFIDPVNFVPKVYDIILFRDLTTHDFSGGNLNAYPKKCRGKEWYLCNPYEIDECDMEAMEVFRATYRKKKERPR